MNNQFLTQGILPQSLLFQPSENSAIGRLRRTDPYQVCLHLQVPQGIALLHTLSYSFQRLSNARKRIQALKRQQKTAKPPRSNAIIMQSLLVTPSTELLTTLVHAVDKLKCLPDNPVRKSLFRCRRH
jgi:hypothetical protein